jgi:hypothetical protein
MDRKLVSVHMRRDGPRVDDEACDREDMASHADDRSCLVIASSLSPQRMLDLEYEECLKATKSRNIEDYDQGPTGEDWDKEIAQDPEVTRASGYEAFGSAGMMRHEEGATQDSIVAPTLACKALTVLIVASPSVRPCSGSAPTDSVDPRRAETLADDEWSEAWATYRQECAAEEAEARARGITEEDVANQTAADPPQARPRPLATSSLNTIANVMAGIKLRPPMWALKYVAYVCTLPSKLASLLNVQVAHSSIVLLFLPLAASPRRCGWHRSSHARDIAPQHPHHQLLLPLPPPRPPLPHHPHRPPRKTRRRNERRKRPPRRRRYSTPLPQTRNRSNLFSHRSQPTRRRTRRSEETTDLHRRLLACAHPCIASRMFELNAYTGRMSNLT